MDIQGRSSLSGRVVVVTGGSGAIGSAVVRQCRDLGATLAALDVSTDGATSDGIVRYPVDISDPASVDAAFHRIENELGRVDALVHAAGISTNADFKARVAPQLNRRFDEKYPLIEGILQTTNEEWRRLISVNLDGTFYCLRAALRSMVKRGDGDVVLISSNAGIVGEAGSAPYSASKGGAQLLMQATAAEVIGAGVRVNAVAPGPTMTPLVRDSAAAGLNFLARVPARRVAEPDEIARAVVFLLTQNSGFIVGETINVNGGILIR